jgi:hypothetical protein
VEFFHSRSYASSGRITSMFFDVQPILVRFRLQTLHHVFQLVRNEPLRRAADNQRSTMAAARFHQAFVGRVNEAAGVEVSFPCRSRSCHGVPAFFVVEVVARLYQFWRAVTR